MKRRLAVGLVLFGLAVAPPRATGSQAASKYLVHGVVTATLCGEGYDIEYAVVNIRDGHNRIRATGTTSGDLNDTAHHVMRDCKVSFALRVPKLQFYQFTIGRTGGPTYSLAQLRKDNWRISLDIS